MRPGEQGVQGWHAGGRGREGRPWRCGARPAHGSGTCSARSAGPTVFGASPTQPYAAHLWEADGAAVSGDQSARHISRKQWRQQQRLQWQQQQQQQQQQQPPPPHHLAVGSRGGQSSAFRPATSSAAFATLPAHSRCSGCRTGLTAANCCKGRVSQLDIALRCNPRREVWTNHEGGPGHVGQRSVSTPLVR